MKSVFLDVVRQLFAVCSLTVRRVYLQLWSLHTDLTLDPPHLLVLTLLLIFIKLKFAVHVHLCYELCINNQRELVLKTHQLE